MDWAKLGVWVDKGVNVKWAKLDAHNIKTVWFDPTDPGVQGPIADARTKGFQVGIYMDPHLYDSPTAAGFAALVSADIARLIPGRGNPVMVDLELLPLDWQAAFVTAYRALRPQRETSVTVAPFQAPVLAVKAFADAGFHIYPQLYGGEMEPFDGAAVVLELARAGFPADRVHPFYDGARLPSDARDGAVFTMERLP